MLPLSPNLPPLVVDPRVAGAFGAAIVSGLLVLQWAHRRKPFILVWAAGWLLIVPELLVLSLHSGTPALQHSIVGISQFLGVCSALLFLWSADLYRQTQYLRPSMLKGLLGVAAWFVIAPMLFGTIVVVAPGYVIAAIVLAGAASMYAAVLIERRMIGAGLIALVLLGLSITNLTSTAALPPAALQLFIVNAVLSVLGALGIHLLVFEDMTYELRAANRRLETAQDELLQAAITDPLTGCHNRRFLGQVMDRELKRHDRFKLPLSMLFVDVDRFKAINDSLGHEAGDRVLQYVAKFLKRKIREADYVFRWGGDEFLVLITCTGAEAQRKAAALKAAFENEPNLAELPPGVGLSVGWTDVPQGTKDLIPLVNEADARMYQDKGAR
jgi:diguanylate cyclase (GGDEF)-like protein